MAVKQDIDLTRYKGDKGVPGPPGSAGYDGRSVVMRKANGFIQWKWHNVQMSWINLIAITDLKEVAVDGKGVELRKVDENIQWRKIGDESWINLFSLDDIRGSRVTVSATPPLKPIIGDIWIDIS